VAGLKVTVRGNRQLSHRQPGSFAHRINRWQTQRQPGINLRPAKIFCQLLKPELCKNRAIARYLPDIQRA
jgi:hypothetical protein